MYHYFKWAALSLFFRRNLRYIVMIVVGVFGIYLANAVYDDMAQYALITKKSSAIAKYLWIKWAAVSIFFIMIVWSVTRLGFARKKVSKKKSAKMGFRLKAGKENNKEDPYMKRLKKFKNKERLRSRSDIILEKRGRKK